MRPIFPASLLLAGFSLCCFGSVDESLLSLVPAGAQTVSSIDVQSARNSTFGQYVLSNSHADNPDFDEFVQQTGFDPRRDLQTVLFAGFGKAGPNTPARFAILARGNFDPSRLEAAATANGAVVQQYQGVDLVLCKQHGRQQTAFAFPDVGIAVMADVATLQQIIANMATPTSLDPGFTQLIGQVGPNNDAWFASVVPGFRFANHLVSNGNHPMQQVQTLQAIVESSGGIRFGNTVELTLNAVARSPQDATALADVAHMLSALVLAQSQKDPKASILAGALDSMTATASGDDLHLSLSIPEKSLEQLAELGPRHHPASRQQ